MKLRQVCLEFSFVAHQWFGQVVFSVQRETGLIVRVQHLERVTKAVAKLEVESYTLRVQKNGLKKKDALKSLSPLEVDRSLYLTSNLQFPL